MSLPLTGKTAAKLHTEQDIAHATDAAMNKRYAAHHAQANQTEEVETYKQSKNNEQTAGN